MVAKGLPEGFGGRHRITRTDAGCPRGHVGGDQMEIQPSGWAGKRPREVAEPHVAL